jgi:hypothetical protein
LLSDSAGYSPVKPLPHCNSVAVVAGNSVAADSSAAAADSSAVATGKFESRAPGYLAFEGDVVEVEDAEVELLVEQYF